MAPKTSVIVEPTHVGLVEESLEHVHGEEVRGELAVVGDLGLATFHEALLIGVVAATSSQASMVIVTVAMVVHLTVRLSSMAIGAIGGGDAMGVTVVVVTVVVVMMVIFFVAVVHFSNSAQRLTKWQVVRNLVSKIWIVAIDVPQLLTHCVLLADEAKDVRSQDQPGCDHKHNV